MKLRYKKFVATLTSAATALAVVGLVTVANNEVVAPPAQAATIQTSGLKSLDVPGSITGEDFQWNVGSDGSLWQTDVEARTQVWESAVPGLNSIGRLTTPAFFLATDSMTFASALAGGQVGVEGGARFPGTYTAGWPGIWSPNATYGYYGVDPENRLGVISEWQPDQVSLNITNLTPQEATQWMHDGKEYVSDEDVCPTTITVLDPVSGEYITADVIPTTVKSGSEEVDAMPQFINDHSPVLWNAWCHGMSPYTLSINTQDDKQSPTPADLVYNGEKITLDYIDKLGEEYPGAERLGGPDDPNPGQEFPGWVFASLLDPSLQVIKQVCVNYVNGTPQCDVNSTDGWVSDTTPGDDNGGSGVPAGVTTGVEEGQIPPGTTDLLWRITAINDGNVPLTGVHVAADAVSLDPESSDTQPASIVNNTCDGMPFTSTYQRDASGNVTDAPLGVGTFANLADRDNVFGRYALGGLGMIAPTGPDDTNVALLPDHYLSQTCTTSLDQPFTGVVQNSVGLNAYFDNPSAPIFNSPGSIHNYDADGMAVPGSGTTSIFDPSEALMWRFNGYGDDAEGQVPSNIDSAQVNIPSPSIKLTKWVCTSYDDNKNPTCDPSELTQGSDALLSMAGIGAEPNSNGTYPLTQGEAPAGSGWAKTTTVPYDSDALWLLIVSNTGNAPVKNINITTDEVSGDAGSSDDIVPVTVPADGVLMPGTSATYTRLTHSVVDTDTEQGDYAPDPAMVAAYGENDWAPGEDVVNTASASADALYNNLDAIPNLKVESNPSSAEANAPVPSSVLKVTKWVCSIGTGCSYDLTHEQLQQLTGVDGVIDTAVDQDKGKLNVVQGTSVTGTTADGVDWAWLPETVVGYNTDAEWLVVVTNIGDASIADVGLTETIPTALGQMGTSDAEVRVDESTPDSVSPQDSILASGDSIAYRMVTSGITSPHMNVTGYDSTTRDAGDPWYEPDRLNGTDSIVNTATAYGTTWDVANHRPLPDPETGMSPWPPQCNTSSAEVNSIALAIGDYVWDDTADKDGLQPNAPEDAVSAHVGVPGVQVQLLHADGTPVLDADGNALTKTTDENGFYYFDMLTPDTYKVAFSLPAGYTWTKPLATSDFTKDSDAVYPYVGSDLIRTSDPIDMNVSTLLDYANHPHVFTLADAAIPAQYKDGINAEFINPTVDAGLISLTPRLKVTKWVCTLADNACADLSDPANSAVLASLAGYDSESGNEIAGAVAGGWAKETTVPTGTDAQWMIVVTNTGETSLHNVTLTDTLAGTTAAPASGRGSTDDIAIDPTVSLNLDPGESAAFTLTTQDITNNNDIDASIDESVAPDHGEPAYRTGPSAVVNTVSASGEPWGVNAKNQPERIKVPGTEEYVPNVNSNYSSAEVNALDFAIGDYVWFDANGNGQQDDGESPIAGATVTLYSMTGTQLDQKTTDEDGFYLFDSLPAGTYQVVFTAPADYMWTSTRAADVPDALNSDADQVTGSSEPIVLGLGSDGRPAEGSNIQPSDEMSYAVNAKWINPTIDAGVIRATPGIDLKKYVCSKGTGCETPDSYTSLQEPNSDWVKQTTVTYNTSADWLILIQNTGNVTLSNVGLETEDFTAGGDGFDANTCVRPEGAVAPTLDPGQVISWQCTINNVTNTEGWETNKDIVNTARAHGTPVYGNGSTHPPILSDEDTAEVNTELFAVGDYVWSDVNGDGVQGDDEAGVKGAQVNLFAQDGRPIASTTTDDNGYYFFDKLAPGDYQIQFTLPDGYMWTHPLMGDDSKADSDAVFIDGDNTQAVSNSVNFSLGKNAPDMVPTSQAPDDYNAEVSATRINPTIDAGLLPATPGISLAKYVCQGGTGCPDGNLASFYDPQNSTYNPETGWVEATSTEATGWVKQTTVLNGAPADWLVLVRNTGNVDLTDVKLILENVHTGGEGFTGDCALDSLIDVLPGGAVVAYHCSIDNVTNTNGFDSDQVIINEAQAEGTPVIHAPGKPAGPIQSNKDRAKVRTDIILNPPVETYAVGDYVWSDVNQDGQQTSGEPAMPGVTVNLLDKDGNPIATTTTDKNGYYFFDNLVAGDYQIQFVLPEDGYLWTDFLTGDSKTDSDAAFNDGNDSQAVSNAVSFTVGPNAAGLIPTSEAPDAYKNLVTASQINPTIDAGLFPFAPGIDLAKYVCDGGTGCPATNLDSFYDPENGWLDSAPGGWVKQTVVPYDTSAVFLIVVRNTGNVDLTDVALTEENLSGYDAQCPKPDTLGDLAVGAMTSYSCKIDHVTNTEAFDSGKEIINEAKAEGTPVDRHGKPHDRIPTPPDTVKVRTEASGIALSKYVCSTGTDCVVPDSFTSLNAPAGWVKATTVDYGTSADWLVLVQNTGEVTLADVGLETEDFTAGGTGFDAGSCVRPEGVIWETLDPGQIVPWQCTIDNVTNTEAWATGKDIVNTARAQGTPVYSTGRTDAPILSLPATAEVNTEVVVPDNPKIELSKYVCSTGTGCALPDSYTSLNAPNSQWVDAATVKNNTSADWLVLVMNTGNVDLANVKLIEEDLTGTGFTGQCDISKDLIPLLPVGAVAPYGCTINNVTNTAEFGSGDEIINEAQAEGTPVDKNGNPKQPPIPSNKDTAKVRTTPPTPSNPPTSPSNPPTSPSNPPTSPSNPPTSPSNPPTSPSNPPTSPANPPTSPSTPVPPSVATGGSAQLPSQNGWAIPLFLLGAVIGVGALVTRRHLS